MRLLIVIVNFRVAQLTIDCLRSLEREITEISEVSVVVCENGSGDDSAVKISDAIRANRWDAWCRMVVSINNLGFCGGNNVVIRQSLESTEPPRYVLLLNPDTVVRPGALKALTHFMSLNPNVGIAGSRLEDPDGTPQRSAFRFQSIYSEFESSVRLGVISKLLHKRIVAPPVSEKAVATDWVAGASMIIRREVFDDIGLLDEGYFTYFDDIDFCLNAKRRGWLTWYVPDSRVVHLVGQSTGVTRDSRRLPGYMLDARRRYFLKNFGPFYAAAADFFKLSGLALFGLRRFFSKKKHPAIPHAFVDHFNHSVFRRGFSVPIVQLSNSKRSGTI